MLVTHDLLGMFEKFIPSFVKSYVKLAPQIKDAIASFNDEVRNGIYPDDKHSFSMQEDVVRMLKDKQD